MKITEIVYEELKKLRRSMQDDQGLEINNPAPLAIASELQRPPTLREQIQRVLRQELSSEAAMQGMETFDEANDFDIEDEFDQEERNSKYTLVDEEFPVMKDEKAEKVEKVKESNEVAENVGENHDEGNDSPSTD